MDIIARISTRSKRVKNKPYLLWRGLNILKQTKKTNQLQNCNKSNKWNVKKNLLYLKIDTETLHTVDISKIYKIAHFSVKVNCQFSLGIRFPV